MSVPKGRAASGAGPPSYAQTAPREDSVTKIGALVRI
jgi:hypothetical protein